MSHCSHSAGHEARETNFQSRQVFGDGQTVHNNAKEASHSEALGGESEPLESYRDRQLFDLI